MLASLRSVFWRRSETIFSDLVEQFAPYKGYIIIRIGMYGHEENVTLTRMQGVNNRSFFDCGINSTGLNTCKGGMFSLSDQSVAKKKQRLRLLLPKLNYPLSGEACSSQADVCEWWGVVLCDAMCR